MAGNSRRPAEASDDSFRWDSDEQKEKERVFLFARTNNEWLLAAHALNQYNTNRRFSELQPPFEPLPYNKTLAKAAEKAAIQAEKFADKVQKLGIDVNPTPRQRMPSCKADFYLRQSDLQQEINRQQETAPHALAPGKAVTVLQLLQNEMTELINAEAMRQRVEGEHPQAQCSPPRQSTVSQRPPPTVKRSPTQKSRPNQAAQRSPAKQQQSSPMKAQQEFNVEAPEFVLPGHHNIYAQEFTLPAHQNIYAQEFSVQPHQNIYAEEFVPGQQSQQQEYYEPQQYDQHDQPEEVYDYTQYDPSNPEYNQFSDPNNPNDYIDNNYF